MKKNLHPFSCRLNLAAGCGERHNLLRDKLAALCRHHALLDVTIEPDMHRLYPSLRHHQNRERPDLVIRGLSRDIHVDTTVLVPMMYSYATSVRNAGKTIGTFGVVKRLSVPSTKARPRPVKLTFILSWSNLLVALASCSHWSRSASTHCSSCSWQKP